MGAKLTPRNCAHKTTRTQPEFVPQDHPNHRSCFCPTLSPYTFCPPINDGGRIAPLLRRESCSHPLWTDRGRGSPEGSVTRRLRASETRGPRAKACRDRVCPQVMRRPKGIMVNVLLILGRHASWRKVNGISPRRVQGTIQDACRLRLDPWWRAYFGGLVRLVGPLPGRVELLGPFGGRDGDFSRATCIRPVEVMLRKGFCQMARSVPARWNPQD